MSVRMPVCLQIWLPQDVSATAAVEVVFWPPENTGGYPISKYEVSAYPLINTSVWVDGTPFSAMMPADASPTVGSQLTAAVPTTLANASAAIGAWAVQLPGLQLGVAYGFTLGASNEFRPNTYGVRSSPSAAESVLVATTPSQPFVTSFVALGFDWNATLLSVKWEPSLDRGSVVTKYRIRAYVVTDPATFWTYEVQADDSAGRRLSSGQVAHNISIPFWGDVRYFREVGVQVTGWNALGASEASRAKTTSMPCREGFGTASTDRSVCAKCSRGSYVPPGEAAGLAGSPCTECSAGSVASSEGQTNCTLCPVGTYVDTTLKAASRCRDSSLVMCVVHARYQPKSGMADCLPVPAGAVTPTAGSVAFTLCEGGYVAAIGPPPTARVVTSLARVYARVAQFCCLPQQDRVRGLHARLGQWRARQHAVRPVHPRVAVSR